VAESLANEQAAGQAEAVAALLAAGSTLDRASALLTTAALLVLVLAPLPLAARVTLLLAVVAGLGQLFLAFRTACDASVFAAWGRTWRRPGADVAADLAAFDAALVSLGLKAAGNAPRRDLDNRLHGARRLLRRQAGCVILQTLLWLTCLALVLPGA